MDIVQVVREAWDVVKRHRPLWFFGFFLASVGAGAGGNGEATGAGGLGGSEAIPVWVWALLAAALVLGAVGLVVHVVAEAATIEGVARARQHEPWSVRAGLRAGLDKWRPMVGIKLAALVATLLGVAVVGLPWVLFAVEAFSLAAALAMSLPLALVALPLGLTGYFVYLYALRFAVLEGEDTSSAIRASTVFLRGRVLDSLKLLVGQAIASFAMQALALVALLPGALVGLLVYLSWGLVPGLVAGGVVALPLVAIVAGASGALRSSIWTCGFLAARGRLA